MTRRSGALPGSASSAPKPDSAEAVEGFMATLDHPQHTAIQALRTIIRDADPSIAEGIKWNAPSFRTHEYFATVNLREKAGISVILHLGAKVRDIASLPVDDPAQLLKWLAKDRALVLFRDAEDVNARAGDLRKLVQAWIACV